MQLTQNINHLLIGLCDDDSLWRDYAEKIIAAYAQSSDLDLEIVKFQSRAELLAYQQTPPDVLFMDIDLNGSGETQGNGIDTAAEVNRIWQNCAIVYTTDFLFYATEVYHTEHVFYVLKDQFADRIGEIFSKIFHIQQKTQKKFIFPAKGGTEILCSSGDIYYFERKIRTTHLFTARGDFEIQCRLDELQQILPEPDFIRCHNSYIVCFPAIQELRRDEILMECGSLIPISRKYHKDVKEAFARWAITQMP